MVNAFICGGLHHEEEEDGPACSTPKKTASKRSKDNNPYSTRGLDKFSELLADLDEKRQKVYSQMNPHDISFVRFAYSKTDDFVPIVVKVKNNNNNNNSKKEELKVRHLKSFSGPMEKSATANANANEAVVADVEGRKQHKLDQSDSNNNNNNKEKKRLLFSWNNYMMMMKHPSFYVPAVVILILLFLTVFGRSVATLCTCIMWYVVPTLSQHGASKQQRKVAERTRKDNKFSEKKNMEGLPSPKDKSSAKHSHQKSW